MGDFQFLSLTPGPVLRHGTKIIIPGNFFGDLFLSGRDCEVVSLRGAWACTGLVRAFFWTLRIPLGIGVEDSVLEIAGLDLESGLVLGDLAVSVFYSNR